MQAAEGEKPAGPETRMTDELFSKTVYDSDGLGWRRCQVPWQPTGGWPCQGGRVTRG